GALLAEATKKLGYEPRGQSLAAVLRDGADRAHDAHRLWSRILEVGLDLAEGERGRRSLCANRHQGQVGRASGTQLRFLTWREPPVIREGTIVEVRPAAAGRSIPIPQLV